MLYDYCTERYHLYSFGSSQCNVCLCQIFTEVYLWSLLPQISYILVVSAHISMGNKKFFILRIDTVKSFGKLQFVQCINLKLICSCILPFKNFKPAVYNCT